MFYEVCKIINIYRDLINCSQKPEISLVPIGMVWAIFSNFSLVQHLDQNFSYFDQLLLLGFEISTSIIIGDDFWSSETWKEIRNGCFQTSYLSFFLHKCTFWAQFFLKARKLWQNLPKFPKISQNFSTWQFFSTNMICDICDKYELWISFDVL